MKKSRSIPLASLPLHLQAQVRAQMQEWPTPNLDRLYANQAHRELPHPKPQCDQTPALVGTATREKEGVSRTRVRFVGYRVRPLDPDNFAGSVKDLLDGLRHAHLILGDEPWRIILETEQVRVKSFKEEKTLIEIISP